MKHNSWQTTRLNAMRARFQKCGIIVDEPGTEDGGGIEITQDESQFACLATVYRLGIVRYALRLRLLSDDPNRVIYEFFLESDFEPLRVLSPGEEVPLKYVSWDPEEDILNDRVKQPFGRTRFREGLLLAEGLRSPVLSKRNRWAPITVGVVDQFDNCYEQRVYVAVVDYSTDKQFLGDPDRKTGGLCELDEDESPSMSEGNRASLQGIEKEKNDKAGRPRHPSDERPNSAEGLYNECDS